MIINEKIAVLDEDGLKVYNSKNSELLQNLKFNFDNVILSVKHDYIIGKVTGDNFAIFINSSTLINKKKYFSNSFSKKLEIETFDGKIIMIGSYEIYIYSKYKNIYVLTKILNILNTARIYQFDDNSLIIKTDKEQIYEYSTKDYKLIKYRIFEIGELTKINNNIIISHKNILSIYKEPIKSFIQLIDAKNFENLWTYETDNIITFIKRVNNEMLLIGRKGGLYEFKIIKNNLITEDKLFDVDNDLSIENIENINIIDEGTILLLLCSISKRYIALFQNQNKNI